MNRRRALELTRRGLMIQTLLAAAGFKSCGSGGGPVTGPGGLPVKSLEDWDDELGSEGKIHYFGKDIPDDLGPATRGVWEQVGWAKERGLPLEPVWVKR